MPRFSAQISSLPQQTEECPPRRIFAARPLLIDGLWMDNHLNQFAASRALMVMRSRCQTFMGQGLCIVSFQSAVLGQTAVGEAADVIPPDWLGHYPHTHRPIDDARGYASLLARLLKIAGRDSVKSA